MSQDLALKAERLRDDLEAFRRKVKKKYPSKTAQVSSSLLKQEAAALAERGLVDLVGNEQFKVAVGAQVNGDLSIEFQRLLSASGKSATRKTHEEALNGILREYASRVIVPLKQSATRPVQAQVTETRSTTFPITVFIGHSFEANDSNVVDCVKATIGLLGITVVTGERPRANKISEKVKRLIDAQPVFIGVYTRRDKIAGKKEWTTSAWVIEEKAYAVANRKKLILLKEDGISTIGGIQGDYEYIEFSRDKLHHLVVRICQLFSIKVEGFAD